LKANLALFFSSKKQKKIFKKRKSKPEMCILQEGFVFRFDISLIPIPFKKNKPFGEFNCKASLSF